MQLVSSQQYVKFKKQLFLSVVLFSLIPALILVGIGIYLDNFFHTKPLFIIIAVIISYLFTNFLLIKKVGRMFPSTSTSKSDTSVTLES